MKPSQRELVDRLSAMRADEIRETARVVRGAHESAAEEIAWWQATVRVERAVRRQHLGVLAASASAAANRAVKHAAIASRLAVEDPDVVATARAASEAAGALVAGDVSSREAAYFLHRLGPFLTGALGRPAAA